MHDVPGLAYCRRLAVIGLLAIATACGSGGDLPGLDDPLSKRTGATSNDAGTTDHAIAVKVAGQTVVATSGEVSVPSIADVAIQCASECTFDSGSTNGATASDERITSASWAARLQMSNPAATFPVTVTFADAIDKPVTVTFRPMPIAQVGGGTWSMDSRHFTRGQSFQETGDFFFDNQQYAYWTLLIGSTLPLTGCESGDLSCSFVSIHLYATEPGDYAIDPNWLNNPSAQPVGIRISVKLYGGRDSNGAMYNDDYRPASGTIRVTRDAAGNFLYSTIGPLNVYRVEGPYGAPSALAIMSFSMNDAF